MKRDVSRVPGKTRGAALVEMTLLAPILFMLLFGIVEMSLLLYNQAMITNASREGARFGILFNTNSSGGYQRQDDGDIQDRVDQYLANHLIGFPPGTATTVIGTEAAPGNSGPIGSGDFLRVTVTYPYNFLVLPGFVNSLTGTAQLSAEAVMRLE